MATKSLAGAVVAAVLVSVAGAEAADPYLPDTTAPIVTISYAPKSMLRTSKLRKPATFVFESDDPAAIFTCRIDNSTFNPCSSPTTVYFTAGKGKGKRHTFLVRATDAAGNSSGTAVRSLRVARVKRHE